MDASDFTVDGVAVEAADWFSSQKDSVFLTVGEQDPDATPKVVVASGGITDAAGNANSAELTVKKAKDGLAPEFTVDVAGGDASGVAVSDSRITITVTANETLNTNPTIEYGAVAKNADGDLEMMAPIQLLAGLPSRAATHGKERCLSPQATTAPS